MLQPSEILNTYLNEVISQLEDKQNSIHKKLVDAISKIVLHLD